MSQNSADSTLPGTDLNVLVAGISNIFSCFLLIACSFPSKVNFKIKIRYI